MDKEKVYIDVVCTEDGYEVYFLGAADKKGQFYPANICQSSGFFYSEDELNQFLEEVKDDIEVSEDFRE